MPVSQRVIAVIGIFYVMKSEMLAIGALSFFHKQPYPFFKQDTVWCPVMFTIHHLVYNVNIFFKGAFVCHTNGYGIYGKTPT